MSAGVRTAGGEGLAGALRRRLGGSSLLGPGGEAGVAHRLRPRRGRGFARLAAALGALGCAGAGTLLMLSPPQVPVELTASAYRVGGATLVRVGADVYRGAGALVLRAQADGTVLAAGDAVSGGVGVSGSCLEDADRRAERCVFDLGGRSLGAMDVWRPGGWRRRYDDGEVVDIATASAVPVPFAVGR